MTTVRSSRLATGDSTAQSIIAPVGTVTGDVVVIWAHMNNVGTVADNNGATPFTKDHGEITQAGSNQTCVIFSRRLQAGDPTTYNFTGSSLTRWTLVAVTLQSPHATTIYDAAIANNNPGGTPTTINAPTVTTIADNSLHFAAGFVDGVSNTINSTPAGYTVAENGGQQALAVAWKRITPIGATGTKAFGYLNADGSIGISLVIRDEGVAATSPYAEQKIKVGYFDSPTGIGLQDVTAGFDFQPTLVRFFGANHGVSGSDQDDHHKFAGAMTAAAQWAWGIEPLHNQASSNTVVAQSNVHCIYVPDAGGTRIIDAQYSAMLSNGFRINWTDVWTSPIRIFYIAYGGADLQAAIGSKQAPTGQGFQDVQTGTFQPEVLIVSTGFKHATMPHTAASTAASGGVGWATGSAAQRFSGWRSNTADTSQNCATYQESGKIISYPNVAGSGPLLEASLDSFYSNGARLNWTTADGTQPWYFWIALRKVANKLGVLTATPAGGNNQAVTGVGFRPGCVEFQSGNKAALAGSQAHFRTSWGAATLTDKWSIWGGERDLGVGVANTISATRADVDRVFRIGKENAAGPSCDTDCAIDTWDDDADGFTIHFDVTTLTGQEIQWLALNGVPPPAPPPGESIQVVSGRASIDRFVSYQTEL